MSVSDLGESSPRNQRESLVKQRLSNFSGNYVPETAEQYQRRVRAYRKMPSFNTMRSVDLVQQMNSPQKDRMMQEWRIALEADKVNDVSVVGAKRFLFDHGVQNVDEEWEAAIEKAITAAASKLNLTERNHGLHPARTPESSTVSALSPETKTPGSVHRLQAMLRTDSGDLLINHSSVKNRDIFQRKELVNITDISVAPLEHSKLLHSAKDIRNAKSRTYERIVRDLKFDPSSEPTEEHSSIINRQKFLQREAKAAARREQERHTQRGSSNKTYVEKYLNNAHSSHDLHDYHGYYKDNQYSRSMDDMSGFVDFPSTDSLSGHSSVKNRRKYLQTVEATGSGGRLSVGKLQISSSPHRSPSLALSPGTVDCPRSRELQGGQDTTSTSKKMKSRSFHGMTEQDWQRSPRDLSLTSRNSTSLDLYDSSSDECSDREDGPRQLDETNGDWVGNTDASLSTAVPEQDVIDASRGGEPHTEVQERGVSCEKAVHMMSASSRLESTEFDFVRNIESVDIDDLFGGFGSEDRTPVGANSHSPMNRASRGGSSFSRNSQHSSLRQSQVDLLESIYEGSEAIAGGSASVQRLDAAIGLSGRVKNALECNAEQGRKLDQQISSLNSSFAEQPMLRDVESASPEIIGGNVREHPQITVATAAHTPLSAPPAASIPAAETSIGHGSSSLNNLFRSVASVDDRESSFDARSADGPIDIPADASHAVSFSSLSNTNMMPVRDDRQDEATLTALSPPSFPVECLAAPVTSIKSAPPSTGTSSGDAHIVPRSSLHAVFADVGNAKVETEAMSYEPSVITHAIQNNAPAQVSPLRTSSSRGTSYFGSEKVGSSSERTPLDHQSSAGSTRSSLSAGSAVPFKTPSSSSASPSTSCRLPGALGAVHVIVPTVPVVHAILEDCSVCPSEAETETDTEPQTRNEEEEEEEEAGGKHHEMRRGLPAAPGDHRSVLSFEASSTPVLEDGVSTMSPMHARSGPNEPPGQQRQHEQQQQGNEKQDIPIEFESAVVAQESGAVNGGTRRQDRAALDQTHASTNISAEHVGRDIQQQDKEPLAQQEQQDEHDVAKLNPRNGRSANTSHFSNRPTMPGFDYDERERPRGCMSCIFSACFVSPLSQSRHSQKNRRDPEPDFSSSSNVSSSSVGSGRLGVGKGAVDEERRDFSQQHQRVQEQRLHGAHSRTVGCDYVGNTLNALHTEQYSARDNKLEPDEVNIEL